jgi:hypothetical protein
VNEEVSYDILKPSAPEHSSDTLDELNDVLAQSIDDWRTEALPERDNLKGNTQGDNERHVIVRGVFLDLFFSDEQTNAFIDALISRSPLVKEKLSEIAKISDRLATMAEAQEVEISWDYENGFKVPSDSEDEIKLLAGEATEILRGFRSESMEHFSSGGFQQTIYEIYRFVEDIGLPYQWLAWELLGLYFARVLVDDFSWRFTGSLDVEDTAYSQPSPEFHCDISFDARAGETVGQAIERLEIESRSQIAEARQELTRFVDILPRGRVPDRTRKSLRRDAEWFYRHKVARESIRSIASQAFTQEGRMDDDRRKDVRRGITKVGDLLALGS